jgi:very-short-patch-repair endonuclease
MSSSMGATSTRPSGRSSALREQRLLVAGWRVVRVSGRQLAGDPRRGAATIAALIKRV